MFIHLEGLWLVGVLLIAVPALSIGEGRRKSELFLQKPYIFGGPEEFSSGDLLGRSGQAQGSIGERSAGSHKVLYGHYTAILETRGKKSDSSIPISSLNGRRLQLPSKIDGPPTKALYKVLDIYRKNYYSFIKKAINLTLSPMDHKYTAQLKKCKNVLDQCAKMPENDHKCGFHCLGDSEPTIKGLADLVTSVVDKFCSPINTIFQNMFSQGGNDHRQFKPFHRFVQTLQGGGKGLVETSKLAVESMLPLIIEKIRSDLMPLRKLIASLDMALKKLKSEQSPVEVIMANRFCSSINDMPAMVQLVNAFYTDPALVDVILGGHSFISSVSKYLPLNFKMPFSAALEPIRMMTGRICGLVSYSENDNFLKCDQLGGFPTIGLPFPDIPGIPEFDPECLGRQSAKNTPSRTDQDEKKGNDDLPPSRKKRSQGVNPSSALEGVNTDGIHFAERNMMANAWANARSMRMKRNTLLVGKWRHGRGHLAREQKLRNEFSFTMRYERD